MIYSYLGGNTTNAPWDAFYASNHPQKEEEAGNGEERRNEELGDNECKKTR